MKASGNFSSRLFIVLMGAFSIGVARFVYPKLASFYRNLRITVLESRRSNHLEANKKLIRQLKKDLAWAKNQRSLNPSRFGKVEEAEIVYLEKYLRILEQISVILHDISFLEEDKKDYKNRLKEVTLLYEELVQAQADFDAILRESLEKK
jgi:hypothetical protein